MFIVDCFRWPRRARRRIGRGEMFNNNNNNNTNNNNDNNNNNNNSNTNNNKNTNNMNRNDSERNNMYMCDYVGYVCLCAACV